MGIFEVQMQIANPYEPHRRAKVALIADTGAAYSLIPRLVLEQIGITPDKRAAFEMADGHQIARDIADVAFIWDGEKGISRVIFGEQGDTAVLGAHALEALALQGDPYNKQLQPAKLRLY